MRGRRMTTLAMAMAVLALVAVVAVQSADTAFSTVAMRRDRGRWVVVSAPGLRLGDLPTPIAADLAEHGVTGLLPPAAAAGLGKMLAGRHAPVLDGSSERDLSQLAEWVAAPPDSVGVPPVAVVDIGTGPGKSGAALSRDLERVAAMLSAGSSLGVVVVSPPLASRTASLTPVIVSLVPSGPSGVPSPASTRRQGIVSSADLVEAVSGPPASSALANSPVMEGTSLKVRRTYLEGIARSVAAVDQARWTVIGVHVTVFLVLLALAALAAWSGRARRLASLALLFPLVVPLAGYGAVLFMPMAAGPEQVYLVIGGITLMLVFVAIAARSRLGAVRAAGALLALTATVVAIDQLMGAPLLSANVFGYSVADGGRFYGLGNEGAGLLLASLTACVVLFTAGTTRSWRPAAVAALVYGAGLAVCVAPWWGANIGVALWGSVLVLIAWSGVLPASASRVPVWIAAAVVGLGVAGVIALDAATGMTHVGRALRAVAGSGTRALWAQLGGRAETAVRTLTTNPWTIALIVLLVVLVFVRYRPPRPVLALLAADQGMRAYLTASLAASLVAMVVEDTGGSVAAYLVPLALLVLLLRLLEPDGDERSHVSPDPVAMPAEPVS